MAKLILSCHSGSLLKHSMGLRRANVQICPSSVVKSRLHCRLALPQTLLCSQVVIAFTRERLSYGHWSSALHGFIDVHPANVRVYPAVNA